VANTYLRFQDAPALIFDPEVPYSDSDISY